MIPVFVLFDNGQSNIGKPWIAISKLMLQWAVTSIAFLKTMLLTMRAPILFSDGLLWKLFLDSQKGSCCLLHVQPYPHGEPHVQGPHVLECHHKWFSTLPAIVSNTLKFMLQLLHFSNLTCMHDLPKSLISRGLTLFVQSSLLVIPGVSFLEMQTDNVGQRQVPQTTSS